jgi:hemolysin D
MHTIGGVVPSAQPILLIIPTGQELEVQAYLENKDVGFVKVGERAQVKVTAFDYTRYGTIPGRVVSVSRDALEARGAYQDEAAPQRTSSGTTESPRYLVRVALARSTMNVDGDTKRLLPGMAVTVEIRTGKRRVIDYFLSPLLHQGTESLHER